MERVYLENNNRGNLPKIAVVAFPWQAYAPYKFLSDILKILEPLSNTIILISGNTDRVVITGKNVHVRDIGIGMHYVKEITPISYSIILWAVKCVFIQILTGIELVKRREDIDIVFFYMAYPYYLFPLIISKILKIRSIEVVTRSRSISPFPKLIALFDPILFSLLDKISLESPILENELKLKRYKKKLVGEGARFIDITKYKIITPLEKRKKIIGFVGRITEEKGIKIFIEAIPIIACQDKEIEFLIIGDGDLLEWVKEKKSYLWDKQGIKIELTGLIKEEMPKYLNLMKLLIMPSSSEGLPTIILEGIACGTIVLSTKVGAISDVIIDGKTGFFLSNTTPNHIAQRCLLILKNQNLEEIEKNALNIIQNNFQFDAALRRYRGIISNTLAD